MMHKTNDLRRPSRRVSISLSALLGERAQQRAFEGTAALSSPPTKQEEAEGRILPPVALSLSKCEESSGSQKIVGEDDGGAALQVSEVRADTSNTSNAPKTIAYGHLHSTEKSSQTEHAPMDFSHDTRGSMESNQTQTRNKSPKSVAAQTETVVVEEHPYSPSLQGPLGENVDDEKSIRLKHDFTDKPMVGLSRSFESIETGVDDAGEKSEVPANDFIATNIQRSLSPPPPPPPPPSPPLKISQSPFPLSKLGRTEILDQILKNRERRITSTRTNGYSGRATKDHLLAAQSSTPERYEKNSNFGSPVVKSAMDRSRELISLLDSLLVEEEETEVGSTLRDSNEYLNVDAEIERILQNRARRQHSIPAHKDIAKEETLFATQNRRRSDMLSSGSTYNRSNDGNMHLGVITGGRFHEPSPTMPVISPPLLSSPSQTASIAPHTLPPFLDTQCSKTNSDIEDLLEKHRRDGISINSGSLSQYQLKRAFPILGLQDGDDLSSLQELVDPLLKGVVLNLLTPRQETNCTLWRSYRCTFWLSADLVDLQWYEHATGNGGVVPVEKILKVHRISNKNGQTFLTTETGTIQFNKILELHVNTRDDELVVIRLAADSRKDQESWYSGLNYCRSVLSFVALKRRMAASV
jgi:hypothetical protein